LFPGSLVLISTLSSSILLLRPLRHHSMQIIGHPARDPAGASEAATVAGEAVHLPVDVKLAE
jgi:hypothetical protein